MRRGLLGLAISGLLVGSGAAVGAPMPPAPEQPHTHEFHWSFNAGHGRLGVGVVAITGELRKHFGAPEDRGLLVSHVEPGSPAAAAGLHVGDVITDVASQPAGSVGDVVSALATATKGTKVTIAIVRDGTATQLDATITDDPMPPRAPPTTDPREMEEIQRHMEQQLREMLHDMPWFQGSGSGMDT
jgi:C-terminal processing protease CtpA/Prc